MTSVIISNVRVDIEYLTYSKKLHNPYVNHNDFKNRKEEYRRWIY